MTTRTAQAPAARAANLSKIYGDGSQANGDPSVSIHDHHTADQAVLWQ